MGTNEHKKKAPALIKTGVISISSSRGPEQDKSGQWIQRRAEKEKHRVVDYRVVTDNITAIREALCRVINQYAPHLLILTGGTGIAGKDVTIEAVRPLFRKELTAFAVVAAQLNYEAVDSAAVLSRTTAGIVGNTVVCCLPGSLAACRLLCRALVFPEAGHLAAHLQE